MARIIKSGENSDTRDKEKLRRSRIIDKDTFNAQLLSREMFSKAEIDERAKLDSALKRAEAIESEAYQNAVESANRESLAYLIRTFRQIESLLIAGECEVQELSQEIIHRILGERANLPEDSCSLAPRTLRVEASSGDFHKLKMLDLPGWIAPSESARATPGKLIIETETFMIQCSFEEIMACINHP